MKSLKIVVTALASAALVAAVPGQAVADPKGGQPPTAKIISSAVVQPFNLAVGRHKLIVADGATSTVSRVRADGSLNTIATGPQPGDVAGVALSRNGRYLAYTSIELVGQFQPANGKLTILGPRGSKTTADLAGYEATVNPDGNISYGVENPTDCVREALEGAEAFQGAPSASYTGIKDSHPYSVTAWGKHSWIVADAGGNDLVKVNRNGKISTVAVLPRQPVLITTALAGALGLPDCTIGVTYYTEAVPTDVEVGKDGWLYVTTLPGGPESPVLGGRGSVYKVNPTTGGVRLVATGFVGATNLALHKGRIYVAEFFAGQLSVVKNGKPAAYLTLPGVVSVESGPGRKGHLYAGTFASETGPGTIVKIVKGKPAPPS